MKQTFYRKVGRRYVPVSEYDEEWLNSFRKGCHLIVSEPGGQSRRYDIDPNYAALIAAGIVAEDALSRALIKAGEIRMQRPSRDRKLTTSQKEAWENLVKEFGDEAKQLEWPSAREVAVEGMKALHEKAAQLMENEAVKNAYEEFLLVCKLSQKENR